MPSKRLTCTITPDLYDEVVQLIKEGLWSSQSAFLRDAINYCLRRQRIYAQLAEKGVWATQQKDYPTNRQELLQELSILQNQVLLLRDSTSTDKRIGVLLIKLSDLRDQTQRYMHIAEALGESPEAVQHLRSLAGKNELNGPTFYEAELAINKLLEYYRSRSSGLPKTDVETFREVTQTAKWRHEIHQALSGIVAVLRRVSEALNL